MQEENHRNYNRYSGKKMIKHIALMSPTKRKSGNLFKKLEDKAINYSYSLQIPRNYTDSEGKNSLPRTIDIYSERLSLNKRKLRHDEDDNSSFKLPTIHRYNSKHKKVELNKKPRSDTLDIFSQIQNHLRPKNKQKQIEEKKRKQFEFIVQTKAGMNGRNIKINQDIDVIDQHLPHQLKLFCVCDGHGVNGHLVAAFIKKKLIENLRKDLKKCQPDFLQQQIYLIFQKTNMELLQSEINTELSGSTVIAIFIHGERIYSFNVGDSRAITIDFQDQAWKYTSLSYDHKPDRETEAKRIISFGGRIAAQISERGEEAGPLRVWMKDVRSPGLAMTRSFGDKAGRKAGTIGDPQILQFALKSKNKYLLIASDGIWEHFQNYEISKMLSSLLQKQKMQEAGNLLMEKCLQIWGQNYISRDDITFILVRLNRIEEAKSE